MNMGPAELTSAWLPSAALPWLDSLTAISEPQLTCLAKGRKDNAGQLRERLLKQLTGYDDTYSHWFNGSLWFSTVRSLLMREMKRRWTHFAPSADGKVIELAIEAVLDGIIAAYEPEEEVAILLLGPLRNTLGGNADELRTKRLSDI